MTYTFHGAQRSGASEILWPEVLKRIPIGSRVIDVGCGNGALVHHLRASGYDAIGVDSSESGIDYADSEFCKFGSAYDDLAAKYGRFPFVVSLEVVEHLMEPKAFARTVFNLLEPKGTAIISTPFHGYWKNLALAASGKMDNHFTALMDGGHIKFFSEGTFHQLLTEAGFRDITFHRVGRIKPLAKSMIAVAHR